MLNITSVTDMFGVSVQINSINNDIESIPFDDNEVDVILNDLPLILMTELTECIQSVRNEKKENRKSQSVSPAMKRLWMNFQWVYSLHQQPSAFPFESTCLSMGIDAEDICNSISAEFGNEIRKFYEAYSSVEPEDALRVARRFKGYLNLFH